MADNVAITAGSGTTIAADDIGAGVLAQRVKCVWGPDGTGNDTDVASGKPMPVQIRSSTGTEQDAIGVTTGAKVITDATGTMQQYLRGLVTQWIGNTLTLASQGHTASVTFTPAATSHTAGDCNGAAGNFTTVGVSAKNIMITGSSLLINGGTAEATAWRLHLYNVTPPSATADDGAWDLPSGDQASYLGYIELGTAVDMGSTQWVEQVQQKQVLLSGTGLFGYLVNLTTLTPANVSHIVTIQTVEL